MEVIYTTRIVKVGNSKALVIPTPVLNGLGWQRGDMVLFTFANEDNLIVKKIDDETIRRLKAMGQSDDEPVIQI